MPIGRLTPTVNIWKIRQDVNRLGRPEHMNIKFIYVTLIFLGYVVLNMQLKAVWFNFWGCKYASA